jgi:hypothetical protein
MIEQFFFASVAVNFDTLTFMKAKVANLIKQPKIARIGLPMTRRI